jgi:hypothetical protein
MNLLKQVCINVMFVVSPGRSPQQAKMLNIARRLVASMTTQDLQFQDTEGDT